MIRKIIKKFKVWNDIRKCKKLQKSTERLDIWTLVHYIQH